MRSSSPRGRRPGLLPVVIGGDIGAYALARQLHDATGQRVRLLAPAPIEAITRSVYIDVERVGADERAVVDALRRLGEGRPARSAVVLANTDALASVLARHRGELEPVYAVPFPSPEVIDDLCDKAVFAEVCRTQGVRTPGQVVVDCSRLEAEDPRIDLPFPLVAKPAVGAHWDAVSFPGKRKIYLIDTPSELSALWGQLRGAGYRSSFVVQERIPGPDDAMRSVTLYVSSGGEVTLVASARVLLEDHSPTMIGNPVAMITEPLPELWEASSRVLAAVGYRGFANLDVKVDPRDGQPVFFEVNPRIGRNSFYVSAAGVNPMEVMLRDLLDGSAGPRREARAEVLYSLVPRHLLLHQLTDPALRRRVARLALRAVDPLLDPVETSVRRRLVITAQKLNHDLKFHRHHPRRIRPTRRTRTR
ncbi:carboxylate--amine ligase [Actinomyces howellii]|uniref:Carbamoyl phosphate synthase-like protein n=1 Tax=Actinomyces howellii TaxID=52771 RepID=A0A448HE11_9ACTO|nr:ATP-grasp domain-containing protein [Actinomyces howellii]VEG25898.1 carbamoyl phosphate synthase-like protein [Actinomyces howellii]